MAIPLVRQGPASDKPSLPSLRLMTRPLPDPEEQNLESTIGSGRSFSVAAEESAKNLESATLLLDDSVTAGDVGEETGEWENEVDDLLQWTGGL